MYETLGYGLSSPLLWGPSHLTPLGTVRSFPEIKSYSLPQSSSCMKNKCSFDNASPRCFTLIMDAASCSYMSPLHVHNVSYPKRLQSKFISTTVRNSNLIIAFFSPHIYASIAWYSGKRQLHFILTLRERV